MADESIEDPGAPSFDAAHFRQVLGHFATGVSVITTTLKGEPHGFTCQSFTSVSLDPPLVAFLPNVTSSTMPAIREAGIFCVNILNEDQETLCRSFASKDGDRWQGVGWMPGPTGSPILSDVLAWIDCRLEQEIEAGDHLIVIGRVVELKAVHRGRPLLFYRGGFGSFEA